MASFRITVNGEVREVDAPADMPLLWVLRDLLSLCGTKFGCGVSQCQACTVQLDGKAVPSCQVAIEDVGARKVTTIEGDADPRVTALRRAWIEEEVPQCGYCQPGQIMAAAALLAKNPTPSDDEIDQAMKNICRCGTYNRIRKAIHRAAAEGL